MNPAVGSAATAGTVRLRDGRKLGYAAYGDPRGRPVMYFHGIPGVRVALVGKPADYAEAGIRLITVDRPGCGVSSRKPGWSLLNWPDDVTELADALEVERFGLIAESAGAPFALACAFRLRDRLTNVVVSSGAGPMDRPGSRRGIKSINRTAMSVMPRRRLTMLGLDVLRMLYLRWPDFVMDDLLCRDSPGPDEAILNLADMRASTRLMLAYAIKDGVAGLADELNLLVTPWGFDPRDVRIPVSFWHGDVDNTVPVHQAQYLASVIWRSKLVICPGEGHMVMARHLDEILSAVTAPPASLEAEALAVAIGA